MVIVLQKKKQKVIFLQKKTGEGVGDFTLTG